MTTGFLTSIIEKMEYPEKAPRNYIGASSIGDDCLRKIWYEYNNANCEKLPNKVQRTFSIGSSLEHMIIWILDASGIEVLDPMITFEDSEYPYFKGNVDGIIKNPEAILEIKTAKDASFKLFVKNGLKKWSPKYYAQIQSYMGMSRIHAAYMLVLNKDNSDIWDEKVTFDASYYALLKQKAFFIREARVAPPRISNSPIWHQCKMCRFNKICHTGD